MRSFPGLLARRLPTIMLGILAVGLMAVAWEESTEPVIFGFSKSRFAALAWLGCVAIYAVAALFRPQLLAINNFLFFSFLVASALMEGALRLYPELIPSRLLYLLPSQAAMNLAAHRGLMTESNTRGDGILHSWKPGTRFPDTPWVTIDENGFSNKVPLRSPTDVIVLGGSVAAVLDAPRNFADVFRERGLSSYVMAVSGSFGPVEWREAYKRYIVAPRVRHGSVVMMITYPVDVVRAANSARTQKRGGDWRNVLGIIKPAQTRTEILSDHLPWIASIILKAPFPLVEKSRSIVSRLGSPRVRIRLDYAVSDQPESDFRVDSHDQLRPIFEEVVGEIIALARERGAEPIVAFTPLWPDIYGPHIEGDDSFKKTVADARQETLMWLRGFAELRGASFIDLGPELSARIRHEMVVETPIDAGGYHANQRGVEVLTDIMVPLIKKAKPD